MRTKGFKLIVQMSLYFNGPSKEFVGDSDPIGLLFLVEGSNGAETMSKSWSCIRPFCLPSAILSLELVHNCSLKSRGGLYRWFVDARGDPPHCWACHPCQCQDQPELSLPRQALHYVEVTNTGFWWPSAQYQSPSLHRIKREKQRGWQWWHEWELGKKGRRWDDDCL